MNFSVITLFPELFGPFAASGVFGRAVTQGIIDLTVHNLRDWTDNKWRHIDDEPYGGGAGMVIQAPPVLRAAREICATAKKNRLLMLSPRGVPFDQNMAESFAESEGIVFLCGRYEGFDERVSEILQPEEVSIGDFILGGGEVAAMVIIEAVSRLVPGVVGDPESVAEDSFTNGLLDYPCYTRPPDVEGNVIPEILRSGNHAAIRRWRLEQSVALAVTRRPDLIKKNWASYSDEVKNMIRKAAPELAATLAHIAERSP
jgi:tRNA (guanine37-N1)-methyltransferase